MRLNSDLRKKIQDYSYSLGDLLYEGSHSKVYKGINDITKESVAIKAIDIKNSKTKEDKKAMESEIDVIRKLNHPNILKCLDIYSTINNCYIITQYCDGGNLKQMINKKKTKLKEEEVINIFRSIYKGCKYLNAKGLIHRNIEPSNILIKNGQYKLADFGLTSNESNYEIKAQSPLLKSPYHNPSQLKNCILKSKCDTYSLGVILYELYHRRLPSVKNNEYPEFSQIPPNAKDLIKKLLAIQNPPLSIEEVSNHPLMNGCNPSSMGQYKSARLPSLTKIQSQLENRPTSLKIDPIKDSNKQKAQRSINSQLNFIKFLFKLYELLPKSQLQFIIAKQILTILKTLNKCLQLTDSYNLDYIHHYFLTGRASKFEETIKSFTKEYGFLQEVCQKYISRGCKDKHLSKYLNSDYSHSQGMIINSIPLILNYIQTLLNELNQSRQLKFLKDEDSLEGQLLSKALSLDLTITYYQLNCLCLSNWNDIYSFHELSKIDIIAEVKPTNLKKLHVQQIENKFKDLIK